MGGHLRSWAFIFVSGRLSLWMHSFSLAGSCVCGHCLCSCVVMFVGCWYGVEVGHWWLVVVCPRGHLIFTIHLVTWHCHIAAVVVHVCHGIVSGR